ncbi:hypothetical protein FCE95_03025 [Luteimonas gilva]|uniref:Uncharacterized protein n=1 Tax=Luteimonas gilva TaxID=2572684 RepID=A0A4U5JW31_9GAMM|nr:hypothetical protein [Luteimonas gilva]TKR33296.1 hypothetical protein FCE95_03025 [Luteimonas gilva]
MTDDEAVELVAQKAEDARRLICEVVPSINSLKIVLNKRSHVALSLLVGSLEQARTFCFVLSKELRSSWFPATILHRSQIDYFIRAAYYASPATDAELDRFYSDGHMPKVVGTSGKKRNMYLSEMAASVETHYKWNDKFTKTIQGHWSALSDVSHGGTALMQLYEANGMIGDTDIDFMELKPVLGNVVAFAQLGIALAMIMSSLTDEEKSQAVGDVYTKAHAFFAA